MMISDRNLDNSQVFNFLGGFRSGSTLLINLLGLHPSVSAWYETKCLCEPLRWMKILNGTSTAAFEENLIVPRHVPGFDMDAVEQRMRLDMEYTAAQVAGLRDSGKAGHERYPIGADHVSYDIGDAFSCVELWCLDAASQDCAKVAEATGQLIRRLGALHKAGQPGASLVNKTPEMPRFGAELRECLGPCRIVNLIRDGREVAFSAARLQWGDVRRMGELWAELILQSRAAAAGDPANYLEIRYEDLVGHPAATLDQVLGFLELPLLGESLVATYQARTGVRIAAESRACDPAARATPEQMPESAHELLEELGYLGSNPCPVDLQRRGFNEPAGSGDVQRDLWRKLSGFLRR